MCILQQQVWRYTVYHGTIFFFFLNTFNHLANVFVHMHYLCLGLKDFLNDHLKSRWSKKTAFEAKAHGMLGGYLWPSLYSQLCCQPLLDCVLSSLMGLSRPIKPAAVGYLDMKDVHKKHISLGYGYLFCVLLQAVWKSFWHLASQDFLHLDEKEKSVVLLNIKWYTWNNDYDCDPQLWLGYVVTELLSKHTFSW